MIGNVLSRDDWSYVYVGKSKPNCFRYEVECLLDTERLDWLRDNIPKGYGDGYYYHYNQVLFRHKKHMTWFMLRFG